MKAVRQMRNILIGGEGQHHRFEARGGDTLAAFGKVSGMDGHVNELAVVEMMQIIVNGRNQEIVVHKLKDIINDGGGGDFAFVIAVVVEKAVQQQLFNILVLQASGFYELYLFFG